MKVFCKITTGDVIQRFDAETGKCIGQRFVCGDLCVYETEAGYRIDPPDNEKYQPYHMSVDTETQSQTLYQMVLDLSSRLFGSKNIWEYTVVEGDQGINDIDGLNTLGKLGWELVYIEHIDTTTWWYMKRRVK